MPAMRAIWRPMRANALCLCPLHSCGSSVALADQERLICGSSGSVFSLIGSVCHFIPIICATPFLGQDAPFHQVTYSPLGSGGFDTRNLLIFRPRYSPRVQDMFQGFKL